MDHLTLPPERSLLERIADRVSPWVLIAAIVVLAVWNVAATIEALAAEERRVEIAGRV